MGVQECTGVLCSLESNESGVSESELLLVVAESGLLDSTKVRCRAKELLMIVRDMRVVWRRRIK